MISVRGTVRNTDGRMIVDVDDRGIAELEAVDGLPVMVHTGTGDVIPGIVVHDGQQFVVRLDCAPATERCFVRLRKGAS